MSNALPSLAALLGSRICHDLVSPIGAISNGVELLQMSGASRGPEMELIQESVDNANARIRFFRIAFGVASQDQRISVAEVQDILRDLTRGTRLSVDWMSDSDIARLEVKLAFLSVQCVETALSWGGQINVAQSGQVWTVSGRSERMKDIAPLWKHLKAPEDASLAALSAAEVQFLLLPLLLSELGRGLSLDLDERSVTIRF